MAIVDACGLPLSLYTTSASPHEITLVESTLDATFTHGRPERIIGDRAYDADPLDARLKEERGIELIAPHRRGRKRKATQDGRVLRRYRRRWKVERFFAWLNKYKRVITRYDWNINHYNGFLYLAAALIILRRL